MVSGLLKFILGILLAIAVLVGSGVAVALYFMNRTAIPPAKPIYANDNPVLNVPNPEKTNLKPKATPKSTTTANPITSPSDTPTEKSTPAELPPGAYSGRVTWSEGLSLRSEPDQDAERVGGVGFNAKIIVLEENADKSWVKIRIEDTKQEGWVKIGNIEKLEQ